MEHLKTLMEESGADMFEEIVLALLEDVSDRLNFEYDESTLTKIAASVKIAHHRKSARACERDAAAFAVVAGLKAPSSRDWPTSRQVEPASGERRAFTGLLLLGNDLLSLVAGCFPAKVSWVRLWRPPALVAQPLACGFW